MPLASHHAEIVIIGGGIVGAAACYYLARGGVSCLLVEGRQIAAGASGNAAGLLSPPLGERAGPELGPLAQAGFELHANLPQELFDSAGSEYGHHRSPSLVVAPTPTVAGQLQSLLEQPGSILRGAHWLDPDPAAELCGWIDRPIAGAICQPQAASVNPRALTDAFIKSAARAGARLAFDQVEAIAGGGGRFTVTGRSGDRYTGGQLLLAAGPWSSALGQMLNFRVPVSPLKGQILRLAVPGPFCPVGFSDSHGNYLSPRADGQVWIGTTEETVGFASSITVPAREQILRQARSFCSRVDRAEVLVQTACLRPVTPDGLPLIGPVPGLDGAWICGGHGRAGILLGPISARELCARIQGHAGSLDLAPFIPGRFKS